MGTLGTGDSVKNLWAAGGNKSSCLINKCWFAPVNVAKPVQYIDRGNRRVASPRARSEQSLGLHVWDAMLHCSPGLLTSPRSLTRHVQLTHS